MTDKNWNNGIQLCQKADELAECTLALTTFVRAAHPSDIDRIWLCEQIESDLDWLRLSLVPATNRMTLSRFTEDGDASFYLDESDRIGEKLDGRIVDLMDNPNWKSNDPIPEPIRENADIARDCIDEINTLVGRLARAKPCTYTWDKEWPKDAKLGRDAMETHCRELLYRTFKTTNFLRKQVGVRTETLRLCDELESNLRGLLLAANNVTWCWNGCVVLGSGGYYRKNFGLMLDLFARPFIKAYLALAKGPDAVLVAATLNAKGDYDPYGIPRHLLSIRRLFDAFVRGAPDNVLEGGVVTNWCDVHKHTVTPIDVEDYYAEGLLMSRRKAVK